MRGLLMVLACWLLGGACAEAQTGVLLFEQRGLRPGLCAALRIQLSGAASVRCAAQASEAALLDRLASARARLRAEDALLGVLLERDTDPRLVRMYVVTGSGDQATLAIERIEDRPEPDVDRSLALKVRDAYEVISFVERALPASQAAAAAAVLAKPRDNVSASAPAQPTKSPGPFLLSFLEFGGGVSLGPSTRWLAHGLLGLGQAREHMRYEVGLGARLLSPQHEERENVGRVSLAEAGPVLSARLLWRGTRVELGAALSLFVAFTAAEGVVADKVVGSDRLITPVVGLGPDLRVRLFGFAYLRFAPSLELATIRQQYEVNDQLVIDAGTLSVTLPVSLLVTFPVHRIPESFQP